jgi:hypothetical protein
MNSDVTQFVINGFKPIEYLNRTNQIGGGVAIFVKRHIIAHRKREYELPHLEAMWHELKINNQNLLLCVCYRAPGSTVEFWNQLSDSVDLAKESNINNIIITGDLNSNPSTFHGKKLDNFAGSKNMYLNVFEPTRITPTSQTILDQIITSKPDLVNDVIVDPPISTNDHCTVIASLNIKPKFDPPYTRLIWNYDEADFPGLQNYLTELDWNDCFLTDDVNTCATKWTEILLNAARQFIPNKLVTLRPKDKPWYNNRLRNMKRKVIRLFNKAKSIDREEIWYDYKTSNNTYHDEVRKAKLLYEEKINSNLKNYYMTKPKLWWKKVKQVLGYAQDTSIPTLVVDNHTISDSIGKAQAFNEYFSSHSNINTTNASLPEERFTCNTSLSDINITENEVTDILQSLDPNKSVGPDGINPRLLKICSKQLSPSLTKLINMSIQKGIFPDCWKVANIVPLFKNGCQNNVNNYRPVSLLSCISKVLEKVIFKHLFNYLRDNLKITMHQSGFTPGDSTINQLVLLYNSFAEALDKKKDIHIVFCDISKAFDKVWHTGLIYKLRKIGIDGKLLTWFKDYLSNRKQKVVINGQSSSLANIHAGVPQGSVLGPLLFLIYINDIVENIAGNIKLFADDTALYIDVDNTTNAETILNEDLGKLKKWSEQWLVTFNTRKTKAMKISLKQKQLPDPKLFLDNEQLSVVQTYKHLGIHFNNKLNFRDHIQKISTRASKQLDVMKSLKYKLDRKTLEAIYMSYVRPILEYGCIIFDNCDKDCKSMLENIQLEACRIITGGIRGTSHEALYEESGWEKLEERRKRYKILLFHKMINKTAPSYLCELVPPKVGDQSRYRVRNADNYIKSNCRTELYRSSFLPDVINSWNSLPPYLREIESYSQFKRSLEKNKPVPKLLYYEGNRFESIMHARMRMQCSKLKDHLYRLHVVDDAKCLCQTTNETNNHFLLKCPLYRNQREQLITGITTELHVHESSISVELLLCGSNDHNEEFNTKLFKHVHKYLVDTQRFDN